MFIPYRVKNPTKRFPIATVSIIVINVIVYALTSDAGLAIRESVLKDYAFALGASPFWAFFTAIFLHGDPFHILGNMLFFWVFGPSVEDRLGILRFLMLYLVTGFCGDLLQGAIDVAMVGHTVPSIGASGCIMGVLGAYWLLFPWSTVCVFYWFGWFWHGVWEIQATWIIALYMLLDIGEGFLFGASGGIANFAHVGGGLAGLFLCLLMRVKRDTEAISEAKAIQADTKDLSLVPIYSLEEMLHADPKNPDLLRALIVPAIRDHNQGIVENAFAQAGPEMIEIEPTLVASYLLDLNGSGSAYHPAHYLHLAGLLERGGESKKAWQIYKLVADRFGTQEEAEMAMYRMAQCSWNTFRDASSAQSCLAEMARRFPRGQMLAYGRILGQQIEKGANSAGSR